MLITYHESRQKEIVLLSQPGEDDRENREARQQLSTLPKTVRTGSFYSKTSSEVGDWICDDGTLTLRWDRSGRQIEFTQRSLASEIDWKCDLMGTDLRVTNVGRSMYLPAWIIPKDPEQLRMELMKRSKERELRLQQEEGSAREAIASQYNECPLCFFELHLFPVAILRYQSKRSCPHYLHSICANSYKARLEVRNNRVACPVCYKRFTEVKALPDLLEDPRLWFQLCDTDLTGSLDKKEVLEGLLAVMPVERARLEKSINGSWDQWDASGDGNIELAEFIDPKTGLKAFLVKNYNIFRKASLANSEVKAIPSLDNDPKKWFEYWDYNRSGTLERIELARALIKTFCLTSWGDPLIHRAHDMSELALSVWDLLGYRPREKINFEEFMKPFGLADQVIHNHIHGQFFGDDN